MRNLHITSTISNPNTNVTRSSITFSFRKGGPLKSLGIWFRFLGVDLLINPVGLVESLRYGHNQNFFLPFLGMDGKTVCPPWRDIVSCRTDNGYKWEIVDVRQLGVFYFPADEYVRAVAKAVEEVHKCVIRTLHDNSTAYYETEMGRSNGCTCTAMWLLMTVQPTFDELGEGVKCPSEPFGCSIGKDGAWTFRIGSRSLKCKLDINSSRKVLHDLEHLVYYREPFTLDGPADDENGCIYRIQIERCLFGQVPFKAVPPFKEASLGMHYAKVSILEKREVEGETVFHFITGFCDEWETFRGLYTALEKHNRTLFSSVTMHDALYGPQRVFKSAEPEPLSPREAAMVYNEALFFPSMYYTFKF